MPVSELSRPRFKIVAVRLSIGLVQGCALVLLQWAATATVWPATNNAIHEPLLMTAIFLPIIALAGAGRMRPRTLALWIAAAAFLCGGLGWYETFRHIAKPTFSVTWLGFAPALFGLLLIIHALVAAADADRRPIASAATYFDVSSKLAISLVFAGLFAGLLRLIFWASGVLFDLIGIEAVKVVVDQGWFWIPTTTVAASVAFHLTDDRAGVVRGAVWLLLGAISWLLLPAVAIDLAFLAALPFTGFDPLWHTKHGTSALLSAGIVLILLIRCHYRDGDPDTVRGRILVHARLVAALMLAPLVVLAGIGLALRVGQHGFTPLRIAALFALTVVATHAVGYGVVAIRSGGMLRGLASANAVAAFISAGLLFALLTPIGDPARLAVADQVRRLKAGMVTVDAFDFDLLARQGGRYGLAALERLKAEEGPDAALIAVRADEALTRAYSWISSR